MLAAAAGDDAPGWRHLAVLGFQRAEALVAAVARIDIDNDQAVGVDAEISMGTSSNHSRIWCSSVLAEWTPFGASLT